MILRNIHIALLPLKNIRVNSSELFCFLVGGGRSYFYSGNALCVCLLSLPKLITICFFFLNFKCKNTICYLLWNINYYQSIYRFETFFIKISVSSQCGDSAINTWTLNTAHFTYQGSKENVFQSEINMLLWQDDRNWLHLRLSWHYVITVTTFWLRGITVRTILSPKFVRETVFGATIEHKNARLTTFRIYDFDKFDKNLVLKLCEINW